MLNYDKIVGIIASIVCKCSIQSSGVDIAWTIQNFLAHNFGNSWSTFIFKVNQNEQTATPSEMELQQRKQSNVSKCMCLELISRFKNKLIIFNRWHFLVDSKKTAYQFTSVVEQRNSTISIVDYICKLDLFSEDFYAFQKWLLEIPWTAIEIKNGISSKVYVQNTTCLVVNGSSLLISQVGCIFPILLTRWWSWHENTAKFRLFLETDHASKNLEKLTFLIMPDLVWLLTLDLVL